MTRAQATQVEHGWSARPHVDPQAKALHDFRNSLGELVFAAERGDGDMVCGLAAMLTEQYQESLAQKVQRRIA